VSHSFGQKLHICWKCHTIYKRQNVVHNIGKLWDLFWLKNCTKHGGHTATNTVKNGFFFYCEGYHRFSKYSDRNSNWHFKLELGTCYSIEKIKLKLAIPTGKVWHVFGQKLHNCWKCHTISKLQYTKTKRAI